MSFIQHDAELTTQQAADYLNVSRPYLVRQLETGHIPYKKVGRHRRVRFCDLVTYEKEARDKQEQALADLNAEAKRLGLE
jgi:excisionase family DNA binding protein